MRLLYRTFFLAVLILLPASFVCASTTDGTVSSITNNIARFQNGSYGKINFGATNGNVHITNSGLTGYAWGDVVGWINLAPTGGGVHNNGNGVLSGYAWGEQAGWINFAPSNGGVSIDSSGDFSGFAWSENYGWIVFNCLSDTTCGSYSHKINTDYRPGSSLVACNNGIDDDGDGKIDYPADPGCDSPTDTSEVDASLGGGGGGFGVVVAPVVAPPAPVPVPEPTPEVPPPPTPEPTPTPTPAPTPDSAPASAPAPAGLGGIGGGSGAGGGSGGGGGIFPSTFAAAREQISESLGVARDAIVNTAENVREVINTPVGSAVTKTVSTVGVVGSGVITASTALFANPLSVSELFLIPLRLWALLLAALGLKKRHRPWGTVYDSVTKQPLDPAYVVLKDVSGNELSASITDLDGRYGFLLNPGQYTIVANKTHYTFPSKRLAGKTFDELYGDLYFGESLSVTELGGVISKNIPLDPETLDWNEVAKGAQNLMKFYTRHDRVIRRITDVSFGIGFAISLVATLSAPQNYNIGTFIVYVVLGLLRIFGVTSKPYGSIRTKEGGEPLRFAIVRVFASGVDTKVAERVTDKLGRYYCLVPDTGDYYVTIDKKNPDESYTQIFKSGPLKAVKGVIDTTFEV